MFHARLFAESPKFRDEMFQPLRSSPSSSSSSPTSTTPFFLDGHPQFDRPLIAQFCANDPIHLLSAAQLVSPFVDAIDLNLGCPQGIAKKGYYGSFLQDDWSLIHSLISTLHTNLEIPVTAKIRIFENRERTLEYAKMILHAGASILTIHARLRNQKGQNTGLADWDTIRYLRDHLPKETVLFANGNVLGNADLRRCRDYTGVDGVMSAEGALYDPTIFVENNNKKVLGEEGVGEEDGGDVTTGEYWYDKDGKEQGYRIDGVMRRYLDIIYKFVLEEEPPKRKPLFIPSDLDRTPSTLSTPPIQPLQSMESTPASQSESNPENEATKQRRRRSEIKRASKDPNLRAMQAHCFNFLRPVLQKHTHIRDILGKNVRAGDMLAFERVLGMVEEVVREGLIGYHFGNHRVDDHVDGHVDVQFGMKNEDGTIPTPTSPSQNGTGSDILSTSRENRDSNGPKQRKNAEEEEKAMTGKSGEEREEQKENGRSSNQEEVIHNKYEKKWWLTQPFIRPLPEEAMRKGALKMKMSKTEKNMSGTEKDLCKGENFKIENS
ncbi:MAG: hypothetical protein M1823_001101 [Watsoniomyces obsoletus]|nr:MAG: hypothetical protein M1823_001101 [Watsoniomyces obsoletus]